MLQALTLEVHQYGNLLITDILATKLTILIPIFSGSGLYVIIKVFSMKNMTKPLKSCLLKPFCRQKEKVVCESEKEVCESEKEITILTCRIQTSAL